MELGSGEYTYRVVEGWAKLPAGWEFGDVGGVGVDRSDNVYVFSRSEHPMCVFDPDGNLVSSWGAGTYPHAHGVSMGPDDTIYLTDDGDHTVRKCTLDGTILLEIGLPGVPSERWGGAPFNRCTHTALGPGGEIYVSDGYGNAAIHKFSAEGELLMSWGAPGIAAGEFNLPHNLAWHDGADQLYVADRENHRIQVFGPDGAFVSVLHNVHRPCALHLSGGAEPLLYVGELGPYQEFNRSAPNLGPRVSVLSASGEVLARLQAPPPMSPKGLEPGQFTSPHGIGLNSRGDIFLGEVANTGWPSLFPGVALPRPIRSFQKLEKITR